MRLSDLDNARANPNVVLVQSDCNRLIKFIEDKLKYSVDATVDTSFYLNDKEQVKELKQLVGIYPPLSKKWFAYVDLDNLDRQKLNIGDIAGIVKISNTVLFYVICRRYSTYKKFKEMINTVSEVYEFYLSYLRKTDFIYLYDNYVEKDYRLSTSLFNFVTQTYASKVDSCFDLFEHLGNKNKCNTKSDIIAICGSEDSTTEAFLFALMKPLSGSARGFKTMFKQRVKTLFDLLNSTTFARETNRVKLLTANNEPNASPSKLYTYLNNNLSHFIILKTLLISGKVYKSIPKDVAEFYKENYNLHLEKYQRFIWRLNTIPLSRLLLVKQCMGERWNDEIDLLRFLYRYYTQVSKNTLKVG